MAAMALSRAVPPRALALVCALASAGVTDGASAATTHDAQAAASTLITVTVASVPVLSIDAFQGSYATSSVAQDGGDASAAGAADPTGVLDRITLDQPVRSTTHSDPAKNWADAQPSVEYTLHGKKLYAISSVETHAECTPSAQGANTYVHTAPDSLTVLGTSIKTGKTKLPVTGAQLGVAGVDHGSLDVSYSTTATPAHAHMDVSISGVFYDGAGKQLYSGPLQKLLLGDVRVTCPTSGVATPTPTSGPAAPSTLRDDQGQAAYTHITPKARHTGHQQDVAKGEPEPAAPKEGPMLPAANAADTTASGNSDGSLWWVLLSALGIGGGVGLYFATRRRGQHQ